MKSKKLRWWLLSAVIAIAIMVTMFGIANDGAKSAAENSASPAVKASIADSMLDYYFPRNGVDFAVGQQYIAFTNAIEQQLIDACMQADAFPAPQSTTLVYSGDNTEFPLLSYLKIHGFLVFQSSPKGKNPTTGMSASERSAFNAADNRCFNSAQLEFAKVTNPATALQSKWMNVVQQIDSNPGVLESANSFGRCVRSKGVAVNSINDFFNYMDSVAGSGSDSIAASIHFGQLYAKCIAPMENLRDQLRADARNKFFANNAVAINSLRSEWQSEQSMASNRYGVKFSSSFR